MLDDKTFHSKAHERILNFRPVHGSDPYYLAHIVITLSYRLKHDYFDDPPETLFCTCIFKVPITHCLAGVLNVYLYRSLECVKAIVTPSDEANVASLVVPGHTLVWIDVYLLFTAFNGFVVVFHLIVSKSLKVPRFSVIDVYLKRPVIRSDSNSIFI